MVTISILPESVLHTPILKNIVREPQGHLVEEHLLSLPMKQMDNTSLYTLSWECKIAFFQIFHGGLVNIMAEAAYGKVQGDDITPCLG